MASKDSVAGQKRKSGEKGRDGQSKKAKVDTPKVDRPKPEQRPKIRKVENPPKVAKVERKLKSEKRSKDASKPRMATGPKVREEAEVVSDASSFEDFSEDNEDGGAPLGMSESQKEVEESNVSQGSIPHRPGKPSETGQTSREAHQKQKQVALERRASKPLADDSQRTKKIWERLRRKSHVPREERRELVEELFTIVTGRIKEFALKHDTVRVVQTAIKYSNAERRRMIANELKGTYAALAESKYAKFLIAKLLVEGGDKEIRDMIIPEFYGKVRKMINHPEASWILDDIYRGLATKEQKAILLREWYGPEFAIFRSTGDDAVTAELSKIIEEQPTKRMIILRYLSDMTNQLVQKKMTGFTMLHDAMLQYYLNIPAGTDEAKEYLEMVKGDENGDLLKNMAFTKSGTRFVSLLLAHGTSKDRKQILRSYKDTFQTMASDSNGHIVILTALDVIDDTVMTAKSIFPELLGKGGEGEASKIVFLANDPNGRLTLRYLFEGTSKALFGASHAYDLDVLNEVHEIRKTAGTSKKDPELRRRELIAAMSPSLLSAIESHPGDLIATSFGCQLVTQALLSTVGDKTEALKAVANTAEGDPSQGEQSSQAAEDGAGGELAAPTHVSNTPHGGRMFRTLVAGGYFDKATGKTKAVDPPLHFADVFYAAIKPHIISWATGPSSFAVVTLLEAADFSHKEELMKLLRKEKMTLTKAASEETAEQQARQQEAVAEGEAEKPAKKAKRSALKKDRPVGNMGARLLLEKV